MSRGNYSGASVPLCQDKEHTHWGGIVCRQVPDGTVQIGAGHHRVAAAIAAGYTLADVTVSQDLDDGGMIRVYARENATQRGQYRHGDGRDRGQCGAVPS